MRSFRDVFMRKSEYPPALRDYPAQHATALTENAIVAPRFQLGPEREAAAMKTVKEMMRWGLMRPGKGRHATNVVLVRKKDGSWRMTQDMRGQNKEWVFDAYPSPRQD